MNGVLEGLVGSALVLLAYTCGYLSCLFVQYQMRKTEREERRDERRARDADRQP